MAVGLPPKAPFLVILSRAKNLVAGNIPEKSRFFAPLKMTFALPLWIEQGSSTPRLSSVLQIYWVKGETMSTGEPGRRKDCQKQNLQNLSIPRIRSRIPPLCKFSNPANPVSNIPPTQYRLVIPAKAGILVTTQPTVIPATLAFLSQFSTAPLDQRTVDRATALYREWNPTHGIDMGDAFVAATALETGGKIFCLNTRHYPMPDLIVEKAW